MILNILFKFQKSIRIYFRYFFRFESILFGIRIESTKTIRFRIDSLKKIDLNRSQESIRIHVNDCYSLFFLIQFDSISNRFRIDFESISNRFQIDFESICIPCISYKTRIYIFNSNF